MGKTPENLVFHLKIQSCKKTAEINLYIYKYIYIYIYMYISPLSSSCHASSVDLPDPLLPPFSIVHHSQ